MKNVGLLELISILLGFFVMGFVDVVGIATNYIKQDFLLSDSISNIAPMMVFFWFFVCAIPSGIIMSKVGRKNTVLLSFGITFVAMLISLLYNNFLCLLCAFALLGIGNTILQVSLNPMVAQVVSEKKIASLLTLGQFVKAISSFLGPIVASAAALYWGNWKLLFAVCMIMTFFAAACLFLFVRHEKHEMSHSVNFHSVYVLFCEKKMALLFIGILIIVGVDVGLNISIPKLLMSKVHLSLNEAGLGTSLYFISRTLGAFIGAFLLTRIVGGLFMRICMIISVIAFMLLFFVNELYFLLALIVIIGLACSNVFSILFSYALRYKPQQKNEVSSLMVMGISGGALIMPIMGFLSDSLGIVASLLPLLLGIFYLLWIAGFLEQKTV